MYNIGWFICRCNIRQVSLKFLVIRATTLAAKKTISIFLGFKCRNELFFLTC